MVEADADLITDRMLGFMLVIGADLIILTAFAWAASFVSTATFVGVTLLTVGSFAAWIGYRWRAIRRAAASSPVDTLKQRYAAGEIDEATFEHQLNQLLETDEAPKTSVADEITTQSADESQSDTHPADESPSDTHPADESPSDTHPADESPSDTQSADDKSATTESDAATDERDSV